MMYCPIILKFLQRVILFFLAFCCTLNNTVAYAAPLAKQSESLLRKCEEIKEAELRVELNQILQEFLNDRTNIDFQDVVRRQWQTLKLDTVLDSQIDNAVFRVSHDAGIVQRFKSSWMPSKAEALTKEVMNDAFDSPMLKGKLNQLSANIAEETSNRLEASSAQSSSYALTCLQQFVGQQYSQGLAAAFNKKLTKIENEAIVSEQFSALVPHSTHVSGIAGGSILLGPVIMKGIQKRITNTIANRIFQNVGERLLGRLGSSFIPYVGQVVGVGLIAGDVIKSFDGALPEIQKALKAPEVKRTIQQDIAKASEDSIRNETEYISREMATESYAIWLDFQKDYQDALSLAKESPEFSAILAQTTNLAKLCQLVSVALNNMGRSQLIAVIQDGTFERALFYPESSYKILETTRNFSTLVEWVDLAGSRLGDVTNLELYKELSPEEIDRPLLIDILSLQDAPTIAKIALLDSDSIRSLLSIAKPNLLAISERLSIEDLHRLASYMKELEQSKKNHLVKFLLNDDPSLIKNTEVMTHIIQSREIDTAIEFWEAPLNQWSLISGAYNLINGSVSWRLIADKFGIPAQAMMILLPAALMLCLLPVISIFLRQVRNSTTQTQNSFGEPNAN